MIQQWRNLNKIIVIKGIILDCILAANLLLNICALNYTTATDTGFYPALISIFSVLYAAVFLREKLEAQTWLAAIISLMGTASLIFQSFNASAQWRGDFLALLATLVYVFYIYTMDNITKKYNQPIALWCIQIIAVACLSSIIFFTVTDWSSINFHSHSDIYLYRPYDDFITNFNSHLYTTFRFPFVYGLSLLARTNLDSRFSLLLFK